MTETQMCFHPFLDEVGHCPECGITVSMGVEIQERKPKGFVEWVDEKGWRGVMSEPGYWAKWRYKDAVFEVMQCWPELIALVEAVEWVQKETYSATRGVVLARALDDLNAKAKEVMGE